MSRAEFTALPRTRNADLLDVLSMHIDQVLDIDGDAELVR